MPGPAVAKTVGVVVSHQNDHGIIGDAGILKTLYEACEGTFQLHLITDIVLRLFVILVADDGIDLIIIMPDKITVFLVGGVPAHGHVINAEGLVADIGGKCPFDHLCIRRVSLTAEVLDMMSRGKVCVVAEVFVGPLTMVEGVGTVMEGKAEVAEALQLIAHAEVMVMIGDVRDRLVSCRGIKAFNEGKLSCRRAAAPGRLVKVGEIEAVPGKTPECRRKLRADEGITVGLRADHDQVLSAENARVFILKGRLPG